jgi:hypothetical protein
MVVMLIMISFSPQISANLAGQIFLDGIIQEATLDATCVTACATSFPDTAGLAATAVDPQFVRRYNCQDRCGGTLRVNGEVVTVPRNLLINFPAVSLYFGQLFRDGATPLTATSKTYLALADPPNPVGATYTATVTANQMADPATPGARIIVAEVIRVSQTQVVHGEGECPPPNTSLRVCNGR